MNPSLVTRDSKILLSIGNSNNRGIVTFGPPVAIDSLTDLATQPGRGHELRPQMWFGAGKLHISAAVLHDDQTQGFFELVEERVPGRPGPDGVANTADDGTVLKYVETREPKGELEPVKTREGVWRRFTEFIVDSVPKFPVTDGMPSFGGLPQLERRHTEEIGLWMGTPGPTGTRWLTYTNVWRSRIGLHPTTGRNEQVDFNPWGINMFDTGRIAFAGDYDNVVTRAFVPTPLGIGYLPNIALQDTEPVYVSWTDNRNVARTAFA